MIPLWNKLKNKFPNRIKYINMSANHNLHDLENQFHRAMLGIYKTARSRCRYNATRFLQMVTEYGGLQAAKNFYILPDYNTDLKNYGNVVALILLWKA